MPGFLLKLQRCIIELILREFCLWNDLAGLSIFCVLLNNSEDCLGQNLDSGYTHAQSTADPICFPVSVAAETWDKSQLLSGSSCPTMSLTSRWGFLWGQTFQWQASHMVSHSSTSPQSFLRTKTIPETMFLSHTPGHHQIQTRRVWKCGGCWLIPLTSWPDFSGRQQWLMWCSC